MKGTRKHFNDDFTLKPGEYGKDPKNGVWYGCTPNGLLGNFKHHEVVEHEDGTISVSPSILVKLSDIKQWHGYLKRGEWKEC